jgi:hypothetical protein
MVLRGQGVDQGVSGTSVVADLVVAELAFEQKAGALGDPHTGMITGVARDLVTFPLRFPVSAGAWLDILYLSRLQLG